MVELLLEHGADPLIKLRSGLHPLEVVNMHTDNGIKAGTNKIFQVQVMPGPDFLYIM